MNLLILGRGKTGSAIAKVARERGHQVHILGSSENKHARALTPALLATVDVVVDFTTPEAVVENLRALLPLGTKVVVGTTGWYAALPELTALARKHNASLLHGTNFSLGVQAFFRAARELARALPGYELKIEETHHTTKRDAPSGTALTLQRLVEQATQPEPTSALLGELSSGSTGAAKREAPITSHRIGDAAGLHVLMLRSPAETLTLRHESNARTAFAEGAVRAAEWLAMQLSPAVWDFMLIAPKLGELPEPQSWQALENGPLWTDRNEPVGSLPRRSPLDSSS